MCKIKSKNLRLLLSVVLVIWIPLWAEDDPGHDLDQTHSSCIYVDGDYVIDWHQGRKLKWSNFQALSKKSSGFATATAMTGIDYDLKWSDGEFKINVYVRFYCHESWKNPHYQVDDILAHEQLHFDICELFGRRFYRDLTTMKENGQLTRWSAWRLYEKIFAKFEDYQDLYDTETGYSTNSKMQRRWHQKIKYMLEELEKYAKYREYAG